MINLEKSYLGNKSELNRMLYKEIRSERDIYNVELCIIYLSRLIVTETRSSIISELYTLRNSFNDKLVRNVGKYQLQEKLIQDIAAYRYDNLPKMPRIKDDSIKEKIMHFVTLGILTVLVGGIAFINVDISFVLLLIQLLYFLGVVLWCTLDKRLFYLAPIKSLSMLRDKDREYRDNIWIEVMKYFFRENTDTYKLLDSLKDNFSSRYTVELLHERFIETQEVKRL